MHNSKYINVYGDSSHCDLACTLEENIMNQGSLDVLIGTNAHAALSQKVEDILHMYCIKSHTSKPYQQHPNYTECCIGCMKDVMNHILTFTSAPSSLW